MYRSRDTNKLGGQLLKSFIFGSSNQISGAFWVFHPPGEWSNTQVGPGESPNGLRCDPDQRILLELTPIAHDPSIARTRRQTAEAKGGGCTLIE